MEDAPAETPEVVPDFFQADVVNKTSVELIMDNHRVRGDFHSTGAPRRLVDFLNSNDTGVLVIHDGTLDRSDGAGDPSETFPSIQVSRNSVLFVLPRDAAYPRDPFEVVRKVSVAATIVVPGFAISGSIFLLPDVDPATVPMIGNHHFIPLTDVTIDPVHGGQSWREPLVLVNVARATFYGPRRTN